MSHNPLGRLWAETTRAQTKLMVGRCVGRGISCSSALMGGWPRSVMNHPRGRRLAQVRNEASKAGAPGLASETWVSIAATVGAIGGQSGDTIHIPAGQSGDTIHIPAFPE
jgi:hypothetical protein